MLPGTPEKSRGHTMRLERVVLWSYPEGGKVRMLELRVYSPAEVRVAGYAGETLRSAVSPRSEFLRTTLLNLYRYRNSLGLKCHGEPQLPFYAATNALLLELGRETGLDLGTLGEEFREQLARTAEDPR